MKNLIIPSVTYRHTDPPTKRVLEELSLLKGNVRVSLSNKRDLKGEPVS